VVEVIWQNGRIATAHKRFDGIRVQVAPVWTPRVYLLPWIHSSSKTSNPICISVGLAVCAQLTTESRYILHNGPTLLPLKLSIPLGGIWTSI